MMLKRVLGMFVVCLVLYLIAFHSDNYVRTRKGPWILSFTNEPSGEPALLIAQPKLGIGNFKLVLGGERTTNAPAVVRFSGPGLSIPFGTIIFFDTTYLPGTVTLDLFGHGVELLPRALRVNRKEIPWQGETTLRLEPSEKATPKPIKRKR